MTANHSRAINTAIAALAPASAAYASFNSLGNGPLCSNYSCVLWIALIAGLVGVPVSILILWALSVLARNRQRPLKVRVWWVVANGVIAYAITVTMLLLGPSRGVNWAYAYLVYAALFTLASALMDRRSPA
jgi:hypothetical protein